MKEAASEANMTVVAIILIGLIVAVVMPLINSMMGNTNLKAQCMNGGGYCDGKTCSGGSYDGQPCEG